MAVRRSSTARIRKARHARKPLALEAMESRQLLAIFTVLNNGDSGPGTLRQAIISANSTPGANTIKFNLPQTELTITPLSALPAITGTSQTIDGTTQTGWSSTTGTPLVVINGTSGQAPGFDVQGGGDTIKGLVINNFSNTGNLNQNGDAAGIFLEGSPGDVVQDCYIGTAASGLVAAGNANNGIRVQANSCTIGGTGVTQRNVLSGNGGNGILVQNANKEVIEGNDIGVGPDGATVVANGGNGIELDNSVGDQIGGIALGAGNVISGNGGDGIFIFTGNNTGDVIQGNEIGTDITGTVAKANLGDGILIQAAASITIGGVGAAGNVISGNAGNGILLLGTQTTGVLIAGNKIGAPATGTAAVPNKDAGILVQGAINDVIGGATASLGNVIANNGPTGDALDNSGVSVLAGQNIEVLSNTMFNNANGGILLSPGTNAPNQQTGVSQQAPTITSVQTAAGQTEVVGSFTADPATGANSNFTVQFFTNKSADNAGLFEGQTFIGQTVVTTDANGNGTFDVRMPVGANVGDTLTATVTQAVIQDTSEFSVGTPITAAPTTDLKITVVPSANPDLFGANETYTVTIANVGTNDDPNVVYTGQLDANSTFVSATQSQPAATTPTGANNIVTATLGTIPAGQSATVTITVSPNSAGAGTNISLTSTAVGTIIDTSPSNNTNVVTTVPVISAATFSVSISGSPNPVPVGGNLNYVVTVLNTGPSDDPNVNLTDTLPASVTIDDVNSTQGEVSENGNIVSVELDDVPAGGSATITITVTPNQAGQITDFATVTPSVADPVSGGANNTATPFVVSVEPAVNLAIAASPNPAVGTAGSPLTFNLSVTNDNDPTTGLTTANATGVVVEDQLPANIDPTQVTVGNLPVGATYVISGSLITITFGELDANAPAATASITVVPTASGTYTNTATVSDANEIDVNTTATTAVTTVLVSPVDVGVQIATNETFASIGGNLVYTITVTNAGPSAAAGVVLSDVLSGLIKANPVAVASQGTASIKGSTLTASLGTIASGGKATVLLTVVPTASGVLTDTAAVGSQNVDSNSANNTATNTMLVSPSDLVVTGISSVKAPIQGDPFVYGFTVYNAGPAAAPNTFLQLALPANVAYNSSMSSVGFTGYSAAANVLSAALGTLPAGGTGLIWVTVTPTATGSLKATGAALSSNYDPNAANNTATVSNTATNFPGVFDLSAAGYSVNENGGMVPITIDRLNGTLGAIAVTYTTVPLSAQPGVNYTTTAGTVLFAAGQTSAIVEVPVQDDGKITPNLTFYFSVTGANNGGTLGAQVAAPVTVVNVDRDLTPPLVNAVVPVEVNGVIAGYVVDFSKPLNPATASNPNNYHLFLSGRDLGIGNVFLPVTPVYSAATDSVTLIPSAPLYENIFYGIMINGSTASGVSDLSGNLLAGDATALAGRDYDALVGMGSSLGYYDSRGDYVSLLSTGDQMEVIRNFSGDAYEMELYGGGAGASVRGSVRGAGTSIGEMIGLGSFGTTNLTGLTTPPFYVALSEFIAPQPIPQSVTKAAIIGDTIPNGPAYVFNRIRAAG